MLHKVIMKSLVAMVALVAMPALAEVREDAAATFQKGKALLAEANFNDALVSFRTAARFDTGNQEYLQAYSQLVQVIRMRQDLAKTQDPEKWFSKARALRTFYYDHLLFEEALPLDRKIHAERLAENSAAALAETLLALGDNAEAAEMLSKESSSPRTDVLMGLALAREGRMSEAKTASSKAAVSKNSGPRAFFALARLQALIGDSEGAVEALRKSFELTSPSRLDSLKDEARQCPDFGALASIPAFAEALETGSKVKESGCSKGTSCGGCPHRSTCAGSDH
ncbi:MAG: tetratricopeptide repeat protein [Phycisphaerales bacterium]|nr:MAG: tetratricopeptide repeat protein [Phycisphaerales bacterium]